MIAFFGTFAQKKKKMLLNWLDAPNTSFSRYHEDKNLAKIIASYHDDGSSLAEAQIALIGVNTEKADKIRSEIYNLTEIPLKIVDLGNLKNEKPAFAIQIMGFLLKSNILPILFGGDEGFIFSLYHAFQLNEKMVNLAIVDRSIRFTAKKSDEKAYLNPLLNPPHQNLFHLSILGTQTHLTHPYLFEVLKDNDFDTISLGKINADLSETEPIIRDADLFSFNLSAIKHADFPSQKEPFPTGLTAQEACAMSRFAGMSDKLSAFGLFGYEESIDNQSIGAKMSALIIWYFLDGFANRQQEFPLTKKGLKKYIVFFKKDDVQIAFWKSIKTGRWWMEIPITKKDQPTRHALLPCTHNDYLMATNDQLPNRLLSGLSRIG